MGKKYLHYGDGQPVITGGFGHVCRTGGGFAPGRVSPKKSRFGRE
jgi:hypothetical protein